MTKLDIGATWLVESGHNLYLYNINIKTMIHLFDLVLSFLLVGLFLHHFKRKESL